jgi:hypothetical protein
MKSAIAAALYIGVVDSVDNEFANVEITTNNDVVFATLPVAMFPCGIDEGDMFYFEHVDGVTEIRCGEPE